jgi:hypothetical protein
MCVNCLSNAEFVAAKIALAAVVLKNPVHQALADLGVVAPPCIEMRDAHIVGFLRSLDLDAGEVLGADVVARADEWVASGAQRPARAARFARWAFSARPIGSQSLPSTA